MRKWSSYQEKIFDTYENTRKNIAIEATAGAGKSSTIIECCKRTSPARKILFMAFNKSIAEELRGKLDPRIDVSTFHSKGLKVLFTNFRFQLKLVENKTFQMAKQILIIDDIPYKQQMRYLFELQDIWSFVRTGLLVGTAEEIEGICIEKEIEYRDRMVSDIKMISDEWEKRALRINGSKEFHMDFTDMLYLPYLLLEEKDFPKYDVVFVDESQDINVLQRELILYYKKERFGRLISVGDSRQNIYSFQGSNVSNFKSLQNLPNTEVLPLSITYRCALNIVKEANKVFPNSILPADDAIPGKVRSGDVMEANEGDFILCRNNLPLVEAFIQLLEHKKKASIKGKDFGEALCAILDKIDRLEDLDAILDKKIDELVEKGISAQTAINLPAYVNLEEKCTIIKRLYKLWANMATLKSHIEEIFTEKTEGVVLSTIHKSKGLEADKVFFLNANLIPSPHALSEDALYSEYCLKFVAITRARKELIYCTI